MQNKPPYDSCHKGAYLHEKDTRGFEPLTTRTAAERSTTELYVLYMRLPGIEPGANPWKGSMLPLHQRRLSYILLLTS